MACTVNEEHGFTGVSGLCKSLADGAATANASAAVASTHTIKSLLPRRPDAAIVAEPTNLHVVVAHKGAVRWRCHTRGKAVHSSQPQLGENAIYRMAKVLAALEVYQREVVGCLADHPLCGKPTLSVGTISGGLSVNTVPDRCTIEIDRRLAPGENPQAARKHVIDFVETQTAFGNYVEHDPPWLESRGLGDQHNAALATSLVAAVWDATGRKAETKGVSFGTDAAMIAGSGIPCVVFGPGSIQQAHTADEWVPLAEVEQAAEALYRWVTAWQ
jgi:acetylornithine deacetylase